MNELLSVYLYYLNVPQSLKARDHTFGHRLLLSTASEFTPANICDTCLLNGVYSDLRGH